MAMLDSVITEERNEENENTHGHVVGHVDDGFLERVLYDIDLKGRDPLQFLNSSHRM